MSQTSSTRSSSPTPSTLDPHSSPPSSFPPSPTLSSSTLYDADDEADPLTLSGLTLFPSPPPPPNSPAPAPATQDFDSFLLNYLANIPARDLALLARNENLRQVFSENGMERLWSLVSPAGGELARELERSAGRGEGGVDWWRIAELCELVYDGAHSQGDEGRAADALPEEYERLGDPEWILFG